MLGKSRVDGFCKGRSRHEVLAETLILHARTFSQHCLEDSNVRVSSSSHEGLLLPFAIAIVVLGERVLFGSHYVTWCVAGTSTIFPAPSRHTIVALSSWRANSIER